MTQALRTIPDGPRPWPAGQAPAHARAGMRVGARALARRCCTFAGPGCMVAVGYMDPGNWATSIAGGSRYGEALLAVVVASSLMAMLFQAAAVRLGLAGDEDLAQACRRHFGRGTGIALWLFSEIAIVACNLAEVLGMAIGLNLLFGLPLFAGVCITVVDVLLVLALQSRGFRWVEAVVGGLVAAITACFVAQLAWAQPSGHAILRGLALAPRIAADPEMLYLAVGIVGATVMPHNLYLHSAIVRTRSGARDPASMRHAIRWSTIDSTLALGLALFVNAAILIVAAAAFHRPGQAVVTELSEAYRLVSPTLGVALASTVFGAGLLASGLSASIARARVSNARRAGDRAGGGGHGMVRRRWRERPARLQPGRAEPAAAVRAGAAAAVHDAPPPPGRACVRTCGNVGAMDRRDAGDLPQRLVVGPAALLKDRTAPRISPNLPVGRAGRRRSRRVARCLPR